MMKKILGRTGLEVTQLGFGAMELRGADQWNGRALSDAQAERVLNGVLDAGINFIDTAVDYGLSEACIGKHIAGRRSEFHLATKCGCDPQDKGGAGDHVWTREQLLKNIEGSLQRMKTDRVDILQLHNPSADDVAKGKLVEALKEIQSQGMTRFIGISTTLPHLPTFLAMDVFDTFQIPYSCLQPQHGQAIDQVGQAGAGVIVRGGIAMGGPVSDVASRSRDTASLWQAAGLDELLEGMDPAELILRYTLGHPHCHTTIVGTLNLDHLQDNLDTAAKGPLPADLYDRVTSRVADALAKRS